MIYSSILVKDRRGENRFHVKDGVAVDIHAPQNLDNEAGSVEDVDRQPTVELP